MRNIFFKIYLFLIILEIKARYFFFGFENINNRLQTVEKCSICDILCLFGAKIDRSVEIESPIYINAKNNYNNLAIGKNTYIGKACFFDLKGKISIGENTVISMQSTIISHIDLGKHNTLARIFSAQHLGCTIGSHSYIGAKSTILMGVTLNEGSFVAAGSVVTKDVPPYTMVAGIPAKKIKKIQKT